MESTMSLLELFCHVDAFYQTFLPHWDQELRTYGQRVRRRSGPTGDERSHDDPDLLPPDAVSRLQNVLPGLCAWSSAPRVSARGQLSALRRDHAQHHWSALRLLTNVLWPLYRPVVRGLDAAGGVP